MKVKNISKQRYCHSRLDENFKLELLTVEPNEIKEVPDNVAENWLKSGGVIQYIEPVEVKKLENENEALKKELEQLKKSKDCVECYSDDKTPAQDDCDKCDNKAKKTKKNTKKRK